MEGEGMVNGTVKEPTWKMVTQRLVNLYKNIPEEVGRNARRKIGFEWC
jgi:hypothetical protein